MPGAIISDAKVCMHSCESPRDTARAMPHQNVEIVWRVYDAFDSGDVAGAVAHFAPDVMVDARGRPDNEVGSSMTFYDSPTEALEAVGLSE